jgi:hypothetical protein
VYLIIKTQPQLFSSFIFLNENDISAPRIAPGIILEIAPQKPAIPKKGTDEPVNEYWDKISCQCQKNAKYNFN